MVEWVERKTVLYYSGMFLKNAHKDTEWYAKKFIDMGLKVNVFPYKREIVTERVRIRFCTDQTILLGMRADEVFGFDKKTAERLRKPQNKKSFKGTLTTYVGLAHSMGVY